MILRESGNGSMQVIDHTEPSWSKGLITGALTYSQDIIKHQLPIWSTVLGEGDLISTAPPLQVLNLQTKYNTIISYLHTWPLQYAVDRMLTNLRNVRAKQIILISAYKPYVDELRSYGFKVVYIPMSIDVDAVRKYKQPKANHDRIIYFGNVTHHKTKLLKTLLEVSNKIDVLSYGLLNNSLVVPSHEDALKLVSTYNYGIGVGRAALEMFALDVKQIIAGRMFGGLITNHKEFIQQQEINMNGRRCTYSSHITTCLRDIDKSLLPTSPIINHVEEVSKYYKL